MVKGIDLAAVANGNPEFAEALEDMKDQLLIVLVKRLGGQVDVPVAEVAGTDIQVGA